MQSFLSSVTQRLSGQRRGSSEGESGEKKVRRTAPINLEDLDDDTKRKLGNTLETKLRFHRQSLENLQGEGTTKEQALLAERRKWDEANLKPLSLIVSQILTLHTGRHYKRMEVERDQCRLYALALDTLNSPPATTPPNTPSPIPTPKTATTTPPRLLPPHPDLKGIGSSGIASGTPSEGSNSGSESLGGERRRSGLRVAMEGSLVKVFFARKTLRGLRRRLQHIRSMQVDLDNLQKRYDALRKKLEPIPALPLRQKRLCSLIEPIISNADTTRKSGLYWYPRNPRLEAYMQSLLLDVRKPEGACARRWIGLMTAENGWAVQPTGGGDMRVEAIPLFYDQLANQLLKRYNLPTQHLSALRLAIERSLHSEIRAAVEARVPLGPRSAANRFVESAEKTIQEGTTKLEIPRRLVEPFEGLNVSDTPGIPEKDEYEQAIKALGKIGEVKGVPWDMLKMALDAVEAVAAGARKNLLLKFASRMAMIRASLKDANTQLEGGRPARCILEYLGARFRRGLGGGEGGYGEVFATIVGGPAEDTEPNADQLFPLVIWTVAISSPNVERLPEHLWLIRTALPPSITEHGESGISLSILEAAVSHLASWEEVKPFSPSASPTFKNHKPPDLTDIPAKTGITRVSRRGSSESGDSKGLKSPNEEKQDELIETLALTPESTNKPLPPPGPPPSQTAVVTPATPGIPDTVGPSQYISSVLASVRFAARAASSIAASTISGADQTRRQRLLTKMTRDGGVSETMGLDRGVEERKRALREALEGFYEKHAPEKAEGIEKIVKYYYNRSLEALDQRLRKAYGAGILPLHPPPKPTIEAANPKVTESLLNAADYIPENIASSPTNRTPWEPPRKKQTEKKQPIAATPPAPIRKISDRNRSSSKTMSSPSLIQLNTSLESTALERKGSEVV